MGAYLRATGRTPVADAADRAARAGYLSADKGVEYDEVLEIVSTSSASSSQFRNSLTLDSHDIALESLGVRTFN